MADRWRRQEGGDPDAAWSEVVSATTEDRPRNVLQETRDFLWRTFDGERVTEIEYCGVMARLDAVIAAHEDLAMRCRMQDDLHATLLTDLREAKARADKAEAEVARREGVAWGQDLLRQNAEEARERSDVARRAAEAALALAQQDTEDLTRCGSCNTSAAVVCLACAVEHAASFNATLDPRLSIRREMWKMLSLFMKARRLMITSGQPFGPEQDALDRLIDERFKLIIGLAEQAEARAALEQPPADKGK